MSEREEDGERGWKNGRAEGRHLGTIMDFNILTLNPLPLQPSSPHPSFPVQSSDSCRDYVCLSASLLQQVSTHWFFPLLVKADLIGTHLSLWLSSCWAGLGGANSPILTQRECPSKVLSDVYAASSRAAHSRLHFGSKCRHCVSPKCLSWQQTIYKEHITSNIRLDHALFYCYSYHFHWGNIFIPKKVLHIPKSI